MSDYSRSGWIRAHETSPDEIRDLLAVVQRDLRDCRTPGLSAEWSFDIAYNAVLQSATAALAASGYRAERANKHMRTLETLEYTLEATPDEIAYLDTCRRKRHGAIYERVGGIGDSEAAELIEYAEALRDRLRAWLQAHHPELLT